uniref:Carbonic anhydrase n=1 Tax=Salarias fasciatus TaxID=181472 RepID=A0A672JSG2_SALFA
GKDFPSLLLFADSLFSYSLTDYTTWPRIVPAFCSGTRQSPINIKTSEATENPRLKPFTFYGFNRKDVLTKLENTGRTIKVTIASGVGVSGGGLGERYDSLQFHLHWGNGTRVPGSEHTLNGKQFPMELHIVNIKSSLNGDTDAAVRDPAGLAALGFFIEVRKSSEVCQPVLQTPCSDISNCWKLLTCYLSRVRWEGQSVDIKQPISLNSLLGGVSLTDYFRYNGSLTTPDCNEAVVWTVFKDPIKISWQQVLTVSFQNVINFLVVAQLVEWVVFRC